jgi:hypothetical protein
MNGKQAGRFGGGARVAVLAFVAGAQGAAAQAVPAEVAPPMAVGPGSWRAGFWPEGGFVEAGLCLPIREDSTGSGWGVWGEASAMGGWAVTQIGVTRREVLRPGLALGAGMGLRRRTWKDVGVVRHGPVASVGLSGSVGPAEVTAWCRADGVERITWGVLGTRTVGALVGAVAWHSEGNAFIACAGPVHPRLSLGGWMGAPPWRLGVHAVWSVAGRPVGLFSGPHPLFGWTWGVGR